MYIDSPVTSVSKLRQKVVEFGVPFFVTRVRATINWGTSHDEIIAHASHLQTTASIMSMLDFCSPQEMSQSRLLDFSGRVLVRSLAMTASSESTRCVHNFLHFEQFLGGQFVSKFILIIKDLFLAVLLDGWLVKRLMAS